MNCTKILFLMVLTSLFAVPERTAAQQPRTGDIAVNGVRIHYRLYGQGDPLLLLHGFTHAGQVWQPLIPELSSRNLLIVPDMRGHGLSLNPTGEFTRGMAAQDLLELLDFLEIPSVVGVGHSSGGRVLLHLALLAPERVSAMVLIGSAHRFTEEWRKALAAADLAVWKEALPGYMEVVQSWHPNGEAQLEQLVAQLRSLAVERAEVHDEEQLRNLSVPTLIAHGDRDEINPAYLALELYELLPQAELWMMPNVSHVAFVSHWVHPGDLDCGGCALATQQFPSVLRDFLNRH